MRDQAALQNVASPKGLRAGHWTIQLLGGFSARNGDLTIGRFPGRAERLLLMTLALSPGRERRREELIDRLWPDASLAAGRGRLRTALSNLRFLLEPLGTVPGSVLGANREAIWLVAGSVSCDVAIFEAHIKRRDFPAARAGYRGPLLPALVDDWVMIERSRLQGLYERAGGAPDDDEPPPASPASEGMVSIDAPVRRLPSYRSSFFGREGDLQRLLQAAPKHRLVTLTGAGGCGKTRLGLEAAQRVHGFEAITLVGLAECGQAERIVDHVRAARGLQAGASSTLEQVVTDLEGRHALLLFDNFEHLVNDAGLACVTTLLDRLPGLSLWISSRLPLGLAGELQLALAPLPTPDADASMSTALRSPSIALFLDRARAARADFTVHGRNVGHVAELCRLLDGLPLAIELAASRVREFSPQAMCAALAAGGSVLRLRGTPAIRAGRHASLEHLVDWSWRLLSPPQQAMLSAITVFRGGWTDAQAAAIADLPLPEARSQLDSLVRASLLQCKAGASGELRYQVLRSIADGTRHCASAAVQAVTRRRHRACFAAVAHDLAGQQPADAADVANLVEAMHTAMADNEDAAAIDIALALRTHWSAVGAAPEAMDALRHIAAHADPAVTGHTSLLAMVAQLLMQQGATADAIGMADRAVASAGTDPGLRSEALAARVNVRWRTERDGEAVLADADEALALARQAGSPTLQSRALMQLGPIALIWLNQTDRAAAQFTEATALCERAGDPVGALAALPGLLACQLIEKRYADIVEHASQGLALAAQLRHVELQMLLLNRAGQALEALRRNRQAVDMYRRQARTARLHGMAYHLAYAMWNQCLPLTRLRQYESAAQLMAFSCKYWGDKFAPLTADDLAYVERLRAIVIEKIGAAACRAAWACGHSLPLAAGLALACG